MVGQLKNGVDLCNTKACHENLYFCVNRLRLTHRVQQPLDPKNPLLVYCNVLKLVLVCDGYRYQTSVLTRDANLEISTDPPKRLRKTPRTPLNDPTASSDLISNAPHTGLCTIAHPCTGSIRGELAHTRNTTSTLVRGWLIVYIRD